MSKILSLHERDRASQSMFYLETRFDFSFSLAYCNLLSVLPASTSLGRSITIHNFLNFVRGLPNKLISLERPNVLRRNYLYKCHISP